MNPRSLQTAKREHSATTCPVLQSHFGCQTTETARLAVASHCRAGLHSKPVGPHPAPIFRGETPPSYHDRHRRQGPQQGLRDATEAPAVRKRGLRGCPVKLPAACASPPQRRPGRGRGARRRPEERGGGHHERQERPRARPARSLSRLCAAGPGADMAAGDRHSRARSLAHSLLLTDLSARAKSPFCPQRFTSLHSAAAAPAPPAAAILEPGGDTRREGGAGGCPGSGRAARCGRHVAMGRAALPHRHPTAGTGRGHGARPRAELPHGDFLRYAQTLCSETGVSSA